MPYFFSNKNLSVEDVVDVSGEEARHILVHRPKIGESLKLQGPDRKRFETEVLEVKKTSLKLIVQKELDVPKEPGLKITLFQSVVSEKALDFIFQKSTELGANKIVLFNSQNTAAKLSAEKFKSKQERWNKILMESAKQCERGVWPELEFLFGVDEVMLAVKKLEKVFLTDTGGKKISKVDKATSAGILVGPEGGLTKEEISNFKSLPNVETVSLGNFTLRAETAALSALAQVL